MSNELTVKAPVAPAAQIKVLEEKALTLKKNEAILWRIIKLTNKDDFSLVDAQTIETLISCLKGE